MYKWASFVLGKSLYTEAHPMVNNNEVRLPITNDSRSAPIVNSGSKSLIQFVITMTCINLVLLAAAKSLLAHDSSKLINNKTFLCHEASTSLQAPIAGSSTRARTSQYSTVSSL